MSFSTRPGSTHEDRIVDCDIKHQHKQTNKYRILQECSCFIEFIKRVGEKG